MNNNLNCRLIAILLRRASSFAVSSLICCRRLSWLERSASVVLGAPLGNTADPLLLLQSWEPSDDEDTFTRSFGGANRALANGFSESEGCLDAVIGQGLGGINPCESIDGSL